MKKSFPFLGLLVLTAAYACTETADPGPTVVGLSLDADQALIYLGGTRQFTATVQGSDGDPLPGVPVTWSVSNPGILGVTSEGVVTSLALGTATVRASAEGLADSVFVTVSLVPVRSVTIEPISTSAGDTIQLVAIAADSNGTPLSGRTILWSSYDPGVATVSSTGLLTSYRAADVMVSATSEGVQGLLAITVAPGTFTQVGVGPGGQSCGIIGNGGVPYCWGALPGWGDSAVPTPTVASHSFSSVHPSFYGACGLASGSAFCWGGDYSNSFRSGQNHSDGFLVAAPAPVAGNHAFAELSVRLRTTCGVTIQNEGYCWGASPGGGVDIAPALLPGGLSWISISAAVAEHACGITTSGQAYCWGSNHYGELGTGDTIPSLTPVPVTGGLTFKSISAGNYFTCAITTTDQAYCWGDRGIDGTAPGLVGSTAPYEFCDVHAIYACNKSPVPVAGGQSFVSLGAGQGYSCGLTTTGVVSCWGSNQFGQLGLASPPDQCGSVHYGLYACNQTPQPINSSLTFSSISVGTDHVCGISGARAYCWGNNLAGELGDPSIPGFSASPVRVVDP